MPLRRTAPTCVDARLSSFDFKAFCLVDATTSS